MRKSVFKRAARGSGWGAVFKATARTGTGFMSATGKSAVEVPHTTRPAVATSQRAWKWIACCACARLATAVKQRTAHGAVNRIVTIIKGSNRRQQVLTLSMRGRKAQLDFSGRGRG